MTPSLDLINLLGKLTELRETVFLLHHRFFGLFVFWPHHTAYRVLVPQPGIKPIAPWVEAQIPNHWTARKSLHHRFIIKRNNQQEEMHRSRHEERGRSFHALYRPHPPQSPKCPLTQKLSKSGPFGFYSHDWLGHWWLIHPPAPPCSL